MHKIIRKLLGKFNIITASTATILLISVTGMGTYVLASGTSEFSQTINVGTLATDIVDASYVTVGSPGITMNSADFSFACQTATSTFGTATEQIYVQNPDAADGGWTLTIAATATTTVWDSSGTDFDFNDNNGTCGADGADPDSLGGQMTIDASAATLAVGACSACVVTNVNKGASDAFEQGSTDNITLLTGAVDSDDIGDWTLQGVSISQTIPGEQPAASDYTISLILSIAAL